MNIVLIGYRGTGKSAVGALLATRLGRPCLAMDVLIVERAGMSIPEIVEREGWPGFRDRESALARELAAHDGIIIDCGGGIIERPENIDALRASGRIIWLQASVPTIVARIQSDTQRPSLTGGKSFTDEVAEVLERRTPRYAAAADFAIETDTLTPEEIAEQILAGSADL
jgi:shikimate kinase